MDTTIQSFCFQKSFLKAYQTNLLFFMQNLDISFCPEVYHDIGYQMLVVSQLVSFQMIFLTQNPLVSGWTNERDQCSLSVCFENRIDIDKV